MKRITGDEKNKGQCPTNVILKPNNMRVTGVLKSPSIIRKNKSKSMRWAEHVARMVKRGMRIGYWWEGQKKRDL
jgi:hypothetical protein